MKAQLVVVSGKNVGRTIPLSGPTFKIGRGETCHLRPNSERVSREHAEITIGPERLVVRDLGSRNGTLVNGKPINAPRGLRDGDLVQVGPLIFSVAVLDAPRSAQPSILSVPPLPDPEASDSWKISDIVNPNADADSDNARDTIMIPAFTEAMAKSTLENLSDEELDQQYERQGEAGSRDTGVHRDLNPARASEPPPPHATDPRPSQATAEILRKMMARARKPE